MPCSSSKVQTWKGPLPWPLFLTGSLGALQTVVPSSQAEGRTYVVAQLHPAASDDNPGTPDRPFQTISRAAKAVQPGDAVLIEDGIYRETVVIEASGTKEQHIVFQAAPMAQVTVTGADLIPDWKREEGEGHIYSTAWPHVFIGWSPHRTHPDNDYHRMIGRAEQILVDNYPLLQVPSRQELTRGTFYVDEPGQRLYIWDRTNQDLTQARQIVQASGRPVLWHCKGGYVQTRGLRFQYAANQAQSGAVLIQGPSNVLEDCVIERMNACGASFSGAGLVVRRCVFRENGQMGFSANAADLLITECVCEDNNIKNFDRGWEAGGNKLVLCSNAIIEKSVFRRNRGHGLWFDIGNENCTVRYCLIADNEDAGIFYEISYGLHAHDNVIIGNGWAPRFGAWGANGGISLSSSARCLVERNLLIANKEGLQFREQERSTPRIGRPGEAFAIWNHDHRIRHNVIAFNRDFQIGGWFDVADASPWPRARQSEQAAMVLPPGTDLDGLKEKPTGLSLEDLKLELSHNLYAVKPGQQLYQWGCSWREHRRYSTLEEVQQALGLEQESRIGPVEFQDWLAGDLRVPANSLVLKMDCYPQGAVPGVKVGPYSAGVLE